MSKPETGCWLIILILHSIITISAESLEKPLSIFKIQPTDDNTGVFFKISDHHASACIQFTGTNLGLQLRVIPAGRIRDITIGRFLEYYRRLHEEDWCSLKNQSEALISQMKHIQQSAGRAM
jgi:hypothetical protein